MYNAILQITECSEALQIFDLACKRICTFISRRKICEYSLLHSKLIKNALVFTMKKQNNASKLLLAIMESRHDSENAEKILYKMRPNELVS